MGCIWTILHMEKSLIYNEGKNTYSNQQNARPVQKFCQVGHIHQEKEDMVI
jgi:hypothetical protein